MKIDYEFKSKVLRENEDLLKSYVQSKKYDYVISEFNDYGVVSPSLDYHKRHNTLTYNQLREYCIANNLKKELKECIKIDHSRNARVYRLRKRVGNILKTGSALFLTLTFTDKTLNDTNEKQRRRYVREFLSRFNSLYVGNVDYGKLNHREHYHALIALDRLDTHLYKYGDLDVRRVRIRDGADSKISKYIAKLTNHAIKETTKRSALIYSRG